MITLRRGLTDELAKKSRKLIRDEFPKVKSQIQGDAVRVSAKSKDDLQRVIVRLREAGRGRAAPVRELPLGTRCPDPNVARIVMIVVAAS